VSFSCWSALSKFHMDTRRSEDFPVIAFGWTFRHDRERVPACHKGACKYRVSWNLYGPDSPSPLVFTGLVQAETNLLNASAEMI
jgi:hypothetical protein